MSDEKRSYTKRKRAEDEAETRARIAQAAVDLHGSVGPAFTTISAVAERAGVRRATVYRHFPDEAALFSACSQRWLDQHPFPKITPLQAIADDRQRLEGALTEIYAYYRQNARMLSNVIRDAESSAALRETLTGFGQWRDALCDVLMGEGHTAPPLKPAAIRHAIGFTTWRALCVDQGLSDATARDLMCRLVAATEE